MADFDILKSMADLNNFIQRQQASMLQLYQFDYEQKKKEAKDKLFNKIVTEKKDPIVAAQEVDTEYQDYNFGNDLLVTGLTVKKMMPANTFAEIKRIDKDKPVYMADNGYATETDAYHNYKPLEYNYELMYYRETNNAINNVQVTFSGDKGSFINDVQTNISYNKGNPIVRISVKDGDQVKVHEFKNIAKNSLQDGITKELQINNPYMVNKIVEGISAGLEKLYNGEKSYVYYGGGGNRNVNLGKEDVTLPPTDGKYSAIDISSNFNNLVTQFYWMDNSELLGLLKSFKFYLGESEKKKDGKTYKTLWAGIYQNPKNETVKQTIEKIGNAALLTAAHIFETKEPIQAYIDNGYEKVPHYVLNIGTTEDEFVIANGETKAEVSGNKVYRRVLHSSIDNGMPIVIYYTGGDKIKNIVGARMYVSANEKQHIDQLSNYIMNKKGVNADFLNRFKKGLIDFTIIGATAFAVNKYYTSNNNHVGDITLDDGTITFGSDESLRNFKNHIGLIANYDPILAKKLLSIWQRSTRLNNIGNMSR